MSNSNPSCESRILHIECCGSIISIEGLMEMLHLKLDLYDSKQVDKEKLKEQIEKLPKKMLINTKTRLWLGYRYDSQELDNEKLRQEVEKLDSWLLWAFENEAESITDIKKMLINTKTRLWLGYRYDSQELDNEKLRQEVEKLDSWLLWAFENEAESITDIKNMLINTKTRVWLGYRYDSQELDNEKLRQEVEKLDSWLLWAYEMDVESVSGINEMRVNNKFRRLFGYPYDSQQLSEDNLGEAINKLEIWLSWALKNDAESVPGVRSMLINTKTRLWLGHGPLTLELYEDDEEKLKENLSKLHNWLEWASKCDKPSVPDIVLLLKNTCGILLQKRKCECNLCK